MSCPKRLGQSHSSQPGFLSPRGRPSRDQITQCFIAVGMAAPSMKQRQVCWGARDEYWKCLDENLEDASQCKKLRSSFESSCPQQWIKYFDKRRDYLKFKEKFEAGQFEPSETTAKS
ncbi:cytochrome c oxidase assembly factor 6 homolog isoform X1 [Pongo pygmaeus]|uniref:cytochrome c oxidase assembly factor 6 homolog isoform X1 n=1 Tax=Pongo abelii TaxID=9601 RepID=UPI0023E7EE16|nr:cytochrome c oxidase assembly factor 6 homolog isoform X1 [Pongo abelii]